MPLIPPNPPRPPIPPSPNILKNIQILSKHSLYKSQQAVQQISILSMNEALKNLNNGITDACQSPLSLTSVFIIIFVCCGLGILWAVYNILFIQRINVEGALEGQDEQLIQIVTEEQKRLLLQLGQKISNGAIQFLKQQYLICGVFVLVLFFMIWFLTEQGLYTAISFAVGAIISILCGALGMLIAIRANYRTTFCAKIDLGQGFRVAYRAGCAMGFALVSIGLLILTLLIMIYQSTVYDLEDNTLYQNQNYYSAIFQAIAGYGLGGSFVALFGRVGGGIYTKAADVGADLIGSIESGPPKDSPHSPATIASNVGDTVGEVVGVSADLFGSFAQSICAALVLSSTNIIGYQDTIKCNIFMSNLMYPLIVMAFGIFFCLFISTLATHVQRVQTLDRIQITLKMQLILSTFVLAGILYLAAYLTFPQDFFLKNIGQNPQKNLLHAYVPYLCSICGLISGMIIAAFTDFITSYSYFPVRQLAQSCKAGPASNVTLGLALGYMSTLIPIIFIALTAFLSNQFMGFYGVSLAALGMLSNLPLSLAINGYGPISDSASRIAEMVDMGEQVRQRADGLDGAGKTTAAIGKGFAIGSAALVSLSLYGGFLHNAKIDLSIFEKDIALDKPEVFAGLLLGAMLPYLFSAFTIRSVSKTAFGMVEEVRRQITEDPGILQGTSESDYQAFIQISTRASLIQMILPGILIVISPLALGFAFGPNILAGFLPGAIVSGVQLGISAVNTGGAWDSAKNFIESGAMIDDDGKVVVKGSEIHKAAVVGDIVGDPLKGTSGPGLNILIKLMAILSLVFGSKFKEIHG